MVDQQGGELDSKLATVAEPVAVGAKARVVGQLRGTELNAQPAKGAIVADREEDIDRARRELVVGADVRVGVAGEPGTRPEST